MKTQMTMEESWTVLRRRGFCGYMGEHYGTDDAVNSFMARYPRGQGIKEHQRDLRVLYEACYVYKRRRSRTLTYYQNGGQLGV
jgi:hypothetical protein